MNIWEFEIMMQIVSRFHCAYQVDTESESMRVESSNCLGELAGAIEAAKAALPLAPSLES